MVCVESQIWHKWTYLQNRNKFTEYTQCVVVPVRLQTLSILKNRNESKYNSHLAMERTQPTRDMSGQAESVTPHFSFTGSPFVPELCLCWNKGAYTGCESKGAQSMDSGGVCRTLQEMARSSPSLVPPWLSVWLWTNRSATLCCFFFFFFFFAEHPTACSVRLLWGWIQQLMPKRSAEHTAGDWWMAVEVAG